jgi:hypothetical protein
MADQKRRKRRPKETAAARTIARSHSADDAERSLGRMVAIGLPIASVVGALAAALFGSMGSALLVLASGALLGTIALLWASVRTLSGDAPLPEDFEALATQRHGVDALAERKRRALRALKDLEAEHALGKIDDADYEDVVARYREDAKQVMREMDLQVAPLREEAERIAQQYLDKHAAGSAKANGEPPSAHAREDATRLPCPACGTSNETDATFCKCGARLTGSAQAAEKRDAT